MASHRRLVLVDDSAQDAEFVRRALASARPGAEVIVFRSAAEGLEYLMGREGPPDVDVVLLDLKLPGVDGHTVLQVLRQRYAAGDLPVVVFTSSRESSDLVRAYGAGANSYVVKPLVYEDYVAVVELVARYWLDVNASLAADGRRHA